MILQAFFKKVIQQINALAPFSHLIATLILLGGLVICLFSKASIHLFINSFHFSCGDIIFSYATLLGDGVGAFLLVIILLFVNYRFATIIAVSNITCAFIIQLLKRAFFFDSFRPYQFFKGIHDLYLVPGIEIYSFNSFPSGHSATIFTTCTLLSLMTKHRSTRVLLFAIACITAFSRVYLSQHFFEDIFAGALIGFGIAVLIAALFDQET